MIRDRGIISCWRVFLGQHLDLESLQKTLIIHWSSEMEHTQINLSDATCYESYVRYPTDVKLLWEGIDWLHTQMCQLCNYCKTRHPRNQYRTVKKTYLSYSKKRRKTYKKQRAMTRRLLYLLDKLLGQISPLIGYWQIQTQMGLPSPVAKNFIQILRTIKQMYRQQQWHFNRPDVPIKQRIVSLFKPYLRPIVRGKEIAMLNQPYKYPNRNDFFDDIIDQFIKRRIFLGLSQEEVDSRMGTADRLTSKWECGLRTPCSFNFFCWAEALDSKLSIIPRDKFKNEKGKDAK